MALADSGLGTLEYTTQAILGTHDEDLYSEVQHARKDFLGAFGVLRDELRSIDKTSTKTALKDHGTQVQIQRELHTLTGLLSDLPSSISSSVERALVPVTKAQTQIATIANYVPQIGTALDASRSSLAELVAVSKDNYNLLNNLGRTMDSTGPEMPPTVDFTPDYSDALNNIYDIIDEIRDNISGFDGNVDLNGLYPGLHRDLGQIRDVIEDIASTHMTEDGFDLSGFTSDVQGLFENLSSGLVESFVDTVVPEMSAQVKGFVEGFTDRLQDELKNQGNSVVGALSTGARPVATDINGVVDLAGSGYNNLTTVLSGMDETLVRFHEDTDIWLTNIDEHLTTKLNNLNTTVSRSVSSAGSRDLGDVIDSFDDDADSVERALSSESGLLSSFKDAFKDYAGDILGILSWAHIKEHMETLHADATMIIQNTGVTRQAALETRTAVNSNLFNTYGMSTFNSAEREQALSDAIRAGMVSQQHLEQATEVSLAYNKLLGTTIDFSQGWAKSLLITKTNADDYLEAVALSIDDFSNNFFVSAEKLQEAAGKYAASAVIFTSDFKSFSKAIDKAVQLQAAQEAANIQSMNPEEFLNRIAWTDLGSLTEQDFARLATQFNVSGSDLVKLRDELRNPETMNAAASRMFSAYQKNMEADLARIQQGGSAAEVTLAKHAQVFGESADEIRLGMAEAKEGLFDKLVEGLQPGSSGYGSESEVQSEIAERTKQAANLTDIEFIKNSLTSIEDSAGFIGKIYNFLSGMGISGGLVGAVGGLATGLIGKKVVGSLLGGKGFGSLFGSGLEAAAGGATAEGAGGATGSLLGRLFGGAAGTGTAGAAGRGFLSKLFGGAGTAAEAGAAGTAGATGGGLMAGLKGLGGKATQALGSKWALGGSIAGLVIDSANAASNSQEWLGADDYEAKWASGLGGALGGNSSGLGGAAAGALKWGAIGTMIAPGIGTAIGAGIGAVAGGIGGEKIAQGFDKAFSWLGDVNDSMDLAVDKLGVLGHAFVAAKDSLIDIPKDIFGGFFTGLGDVAGGIKDGFGQFLQGDILGGFKSIGGGFVDGVLSLGKGFTDAVSDVVDDWTLSAEERIEKRKKEIKHITAGVDVAQSELDEKSLNQIKQTSDIVHTGKSIFGKSAGRPGTTDVSGLNSMAFSDPTAEKIVAQDRPLVHTPGKAKSAIDMGIPMEDPFADLPEISEPVDLSVGATVGGTAAEVALAKHAQVLGASADAIRSGLAEVNEGSFADFKNNLESSVEVPGLENTVDLSDSLTQNTLAVQALTTSLQILNGLMTEQGFKTVEEEPVETPVTEQSTDLTSGLLQTLSTGISGLLGTGLFGISGLVASNLMDSMSTLGGSVAETALAKAAVPEVTGPIIKDVGSAGPENISAPIVDAINNGMVNVVGLLTKISKAVEPEQQNKLFDSRNLNTPAKRLPFTYGNRDNTGNMNLTSYQNV